MMWRFVHAPGCGETAFKMDHKPNLGDQMCAHEVIYENYKIDCGDLIICDSCGEALSNNSLDNFEQI